MKKRLRKKVFKLGRLKYGTFFMDLEEELKKSKTIYYPSGNYYLHEGKLYKFKV